jgi:hypothetical protein
MDQAIKEGLPFPRGASWDGHGVNFPLFSANGDLAALREIFVSWLFACIRGP